jgi:superfamily II DNA helicase RecQ
MIQTRGVDNSFIVVVVPFLGLIQDMKERCRIRYGVIAQEWKPSYISDGSNPLSSVCAPLVFISADQIIHEATYNFLCVARSSGRLRFISMDECHLIKDDFRTKLKDVAKIDGIGVPVFLNTATLTFSQERELLDLFRKFIVLKVQGY